MRIFEMLTRCTHLSHAAAALKFKHTSEISNSIDEPFGQQKIVAICNTHILWYPTVIAYTVLRIPGAG